jgi:hypothetical protein
MAERMKMGLWKIYIDGIHETISGGWSE